VARGACRRSDLNLLENKQSAPEAKCPPVQLQPTRVAMGHVPESAVAISLCAHPWSYRMNGSFPSNAVASAESEIVR